MESGVQKAAIGPQLIINTAMALKVASFISPQLFSLPRVRGIDFCFRRGLAAACLAGGVGGQVEGPPGEGSAVEQMEFCCRVGRDADDKADRD